MTDLAGWETSGRRDVSEPVNCPPRDRSAARLSPRRNHHHANCTCPRDGAVQLWWSVVAVVGDFRGDFGGVLGDWGRLGEGLGYFGVVVECIGE